MESILENEKQILKNNELIRSKKQYNEYEMIMKIYQKAIENTLKRIEDIKQELNENYEYNIISNVTNRIKSSESILEKMKKKKLDISYENMIENINDIAGIRIVCNYKDDIYKIRNTIRKQKDIKVLKEKDYIKKTKKSGYSAYHIIIEVPVEIKEEKIYVKVEIQIRTVLMDFWATAEHKVKYKPIKKISNINSIKLAIYAKIINYINDKMRTIVEY